MKENNENYLEGIYGCLERIEKKVEALPAAAGGNGMPATSPATLSEEVSGARRTLYELKTMLASHHLATVEAGENAGKTMDRQQSLVKHLANIMTATREEQRDGHTELEASLQALKEATGRKEERREPQLVVHRLEAASKAAVITFTTLLTVSILSVWINCRQYSANRNLRDADLKYRTVRMLLPQDDRCILFLEEHFTKERDEEVIRHIRQKVTAFEDSVGNVKKNGHTVRKQKEVTE